MMIAFLVAVVFVTVPVAPVAGQTMTAWPPDTAAAGPISASAVRTATAFQESEDEQEQEDDRFFARPWLVAAVGYGAAIYVTMACDREPSRPLFGFGNREECNWMEGSVFVAGIFLGGAGMADGLGWLSRRAGPVTLQAAPTGMRVSW